VTCDEVKQSKAQARRPQPLLDTGVGECMVAVAEQAALLRHLSRDTHELEAFNTQLKPMEAA
jgi:hypothetical protein